MDCKYTTQSPASTRQSTSESSDTHSTAGTHARTVKWSSKWQQDTATLPYGWQRTRGVHSWRPASTRVTHTAAGRVEVPTCLAPPNFGFNAPHPEHPQFWLALMWAVGGQHLSWSHQCLQGQIWGLQLIKYQFIAAQVTRSGSAQHSGSFGGDQHVIAAGYFQTTEPLSQFPSSVATWR